MNEEGYVENDIGRYDPVECICRSKGNEQTTFKNKLLTDFISHTCTCQALREEKNGAISTMIIENDQSFDSSFEGHKNLSMIQKRDTETDIETAPIKRPCLEVKMSIETELLPTNIFDDSDCDFISPASPAILDHDEQSVLDMVRNEIKEFLVTNQVLFNSKANLPKIESGDLLLNNVKSEMEVKSYKDNDITLKEHKRDV